MLLKGSLSIPVPNEWANFIALALLTPDKFEWVKQLLSSQLWKIVSEDSDSSNLKPFVLPEECESVLQSICQNKNDKEVLPTAVASTPPSKPSSVGMSSSTSAIQVYKKRKEKAPLVETQIPAKDCLDEALHQAKKKKGSKDKEVKEKNKKIQQKEGLPTPA